MAKEIKASEELKHAIASHSTASEPNDSLVLTKKNYTFIIFGLVIIFFGYFLLGFEDFKDAAEFSFALYVSPWVIIGGYVFIIYALMVKDK